ncbi:iron-sulfur binding protein [Solidesulfovibrio carbinoliphilus subsp. oakridgensis]|uniref:Iron-sulfur binding protein n=1 Tax=Solidesulfovibrio carbinoliphilus subsp. oakridgensis TaxID=694327 RepID=G7QBV6_9BACT|nr:4Fe-4S dicluster domain-containing protein [Solidesulfovibrio carbinoliphilus]EHJ49449.1 iron-sulfur binding protein [Solidesulfovibrio carbinoliphilus subsp. oakridgensis]
MEDKTLYIDYSKCIGCETCEYVCRFVADMPRIHMIRAASGLMAPLYCRHCAEANCAKVCKRGAIKRDRDGAMVLQPMLCRGCESRQCMLACPYMAIFETDKGVMVVKCDLCAARRQLGQEPACAAMCPCGAIHYVSRDRIASLETPASREAEDRVLACLRPGRASGKGTDEPQKA